MIFPVTEKKILGGLAGIYYGIEAIPEEWVKVIARKEDIEKLFSNFISSLTPKNTSLDDAFYVENWQFFQIQIKTWEN